MVMDRPITRVPRVSRVALSADHQIQTDSATPHYRIHQYWLTGGLFFSGWLLPVEMSTKFAVFSVFGEGPRVSSWLIVPKKLLSTLLL